MCGDRVFKEVLKWNEAIRVTSIQYDWCSYENRSEQDTNIQWETTWRHRRWLTSHRGPRRNPLWWHLHLNWQNKLLFKPPNWWYFLITVLENEDNQLWETSILELLAPCQHLVCNIPGKQSCNLCLNLLQTESPKFSVTHLILELLSVRKNLPYFTLKFYVIITVKLSNDNTGTH